MNITDVLSNLEESAYQEMLGKEVIGTLKTLDSSYLYPENLRKVLINTFTHQALLINKVSRDIIINSLSLNEAYELGKQFNLPETNDVFEKLTAINFKGTSLEKLFEFFGEIIIPDVQPDWVASTNVQVGYPLYYYQRDVLRKLKTFLTSANNRALLHMPTGSGKTRTSISFICRHLVDQPEKNVIWFANTKELLDQAYDEFYKAWAFLGDREITAIKFWDKTNIDLKEVKGSFIVAGLDKTYQLLMRDLQAMSIFAANCSLVIMDEAHMAIAPTYQLLIENIIKGGTGFIGLSATPGRTWNDPEEDQKLADFFFRQKAMLKIPGYDNPVDYLTDEGYLAKVTNTRLLREVGIKLSKEDIEYLKSNYVLSPSVLKAISEDRLRNMAIISRIQSLVKNHKRIIVFGITKDHAITLNSVLTAVGLNSKVVTSETNSVERSKIIADFKKSRVDFPEPMILCNYGILTTGFDAPETSCAVITRPTDSLVLYSQMVGRAIRGIRSGGNMEAEIVTVIDQNLPGFSEVADAFINWEDVWN
ncbi:DEAD/DEAH box helicase [Mucilaginibacter lutimaris]|uniref:DEAD/DEAH box helicase n=1 Tax=Mucilaginibacter lutimaris TaxID=931629 RepID=A0ABW2ZEB8_9SPHI